MGCCSSGGGCACMSESPRQMSSTMITSSFMPQSGQLNTFDWLGEETMLGLASNIVEVRFKSTRKEFYFNTDKIRFNKNDRVVVEASPGHDLGTVSLTGELALKQFEKKVKNTDSYPRKKIYRVARDVDMERWADAKKRERSVMIRARQLAQQLGLEMKISDVEFQGDGRKAIFYYIAEERVDFRQLIKHYASEFQVKIEMKQIGVRQESARVGGFGSCGRELCCSTWRTELSSVSTDAARLQELPMNAQKLAGQCGKLKCCLMYELENYLEARADFPKVLLELDTVDGKIYPHKTEALKKVIWYSYDESRPINSFPISIDDFKKYLKQNKKGEKIELKPFEVKANNEVAYVNDVGTEDLNRFQEKKPKKKKRNFRPRAKQEASGQGKSKSGNKNYRKPRKKNYKKKME